MKKKIRIGIFAIVCMVLASCGNMSQVMSAMTNGTGIANAVKSVIGLDKVKQQNLIGSWKYKGPGCAFMSENLLAKAGGEMAAVQIEEKLLPYYQQVNVTSSNTFITFNEDGTMAMQYGSKNFTGTWELDADNAIIHMNLGRLFKFKGYIAVKGNNMELLFDVTTMMKIVKSVTSVYKNSTLQTINDLLNQYDKMYAGFNLEK